MVAKRSTPGTATASVELARVLTFKPRLPYLKLEDSLLLKDVIVHLEVIVNLTWLVLAGVEKALIFRSCCWPASMTAEGSKRFRAFRA